MSDSTDPSHPDYVWPGGDRAASKNEIANAVAHIKAWIARELAAVGVNLPTVAKPEPPEQPPVPGVTTQPTDGSVPMQYGEGEEPPPQPTPAPVPEQPAAEEVGAEQASLTDAPAVAAASADPDAASG